MPEYIISTEDLKEDLQRVSELLDKTPTAEEMREHGEYSVPTYKTRFGSWNGALKAADIGSVREYNISRSDLIESMQELADDLGRTPTENDMDESGDYAATTYRNRFDTWNAALEEAGLSVNKHHGIPKADLLAELQRVADELGETPRRREFVEMGKWGYGAYEDAFGSWNGALEAAGLDVNHRQGTPDEELIAGLQQLADELGETPSAKQMWHLGDYDWKAYRRVFGSWNGAVRAAGLEVYEPPTGEDNPRYTPFGNSIYLTLRKFYREESWRAISSAARERDGHVCQMDGCDREDVEVHHTIPIMSCGCNDDELLMSLCPTHHRAVEAYTKNEVVEMTIRDLSLEFSEADVEDVEATQLSIDLFG